MVDDEIKPDKNYIKYDGKVFYDSISDQYFCSLTEFVEYMKEYKEKHGEHPQTKLHPTKPVYMPSLDFDVDEWAKTCEEFPEDGDLRNYVPKDHPILEKLEALKKLIEEIDSEEVVLNLVEPDFRYRLVF